LKSDNDIPELRDMIRTFTKKLDHIDTKALSMEESEKINNIKSMIGGESI